MTTMNAQFINGQSFLIPARTTSAFSPVFVDGKGYPFLVYTGGVLEGKINWYLYARRKGVR